VNLQTGKRIWHYQLVHHGLWDMDPPCAPILTDITVNGKTVKAVAQPTKQEFPVCVRPRDRQADLADRRAPVPQGDVRPASGIRRRSRFRPSRHPTGIRASRSTT
jgi:quinoprotein glucose dehydrogenase